MAQNKPNSTKLREVATTIATSTSPGTAANNIALGVVLWCSVANILPRWSPSSAIDSLADAIEEVADVYKENRSILDDHGRSFETELNKLELAVLDLKEKYIEDSLNIPWKNLPSWLSYQKYAWATARTNRREVDMLKSSLDNSIIKHLDASNAFVDVDRVKWSVRNIEIINVAIPLAIRGITGNRKWARLDVLRIGNGQHEDVAQHERHTRVLFSDSTGAGGCTNLMRLVERAGIMLQDYRERTELPVNPGRTVVRAIQRLRDQRLQPSGVTSRRRGPHAGHHTQDTTMTDGGNEDRRRMFRMLNSSHCLGIIGVVNPEQGILKPDACRDEIWFALRPPDIFCSALVSSILSPTAQTSSLLLGLRSAARLKLCNASKWHLTSVIILKVLSQKNIRKVK
ncbi:hypothetical protein EDD85DRAFT_936568 [Armillaria nabsnona]|nr:hypothetical protein EDD85DRAFT_936568 [Armillaria nabsnona]